MTTHREDCDMDEDCSCEVGGSFTRPSLPIKCAADCPPCPDCGEPWCEECEMHYADCFHPGPHSGEDDERN